MAWKVTTRATITPPAMNQLSPAPYVAALEHVLVDRAKHEVDQDRNGGEADYDG